MPLLGGPSDLSAKRTSENLNTLGVWGLVSQRSLLRKTNESGLAYKKAHSLCLQKESCSQHIANYEANRYIIFQLGKFAEQKFCVHL